MKTGIKILRRTGRHQRIRKKVIGTPQRPRLSVFRSQRHLTAQFIDDLSGKTLLGCSTTGPQIRSQFPHGGNLESAKVFGKILAEKALEKGIKQVVFDRGGYLYHGRIQVFADSAREAGLQF